MTSDDPTTRLELRVRALEDENKRLTKLLDEAAEDHWELSAAYVDRWGQLDVCKRKNKALIEKCDHLRHALDGVSLVV